MKERFGLELPKLKATDFLAVQKGLSQQAAAKNANASNESSMAMGSSPSTTRTNLHPLASSTASSTRIETTTNTNGTDDYYYSTATNTNNTGATVSLPRHQQPCYRDADAPAAQRRLRLLPTSMENGTKATAASFSASNTNSTTAIPEAILDTMQEIREIVKRRPNLGETLWIQQLHTLLQRRPHIVEEESTGIEGRGDNAEGDNDDDSNDKEDEMTSFIHRDIDEFPLRYV